MKKLILSLLLLSYCSIYSQETTNLPAFANPIILRPDQMGDIINYVQSLGAGTNSIYTITSTNLQWVNVIRNVDGTNDYFQVSAIVSVPITNVVNISTNK
jgi:hypothetical protein